MTLDERLRDLLGAEVTPPPGYVERVVAALPAQSHLVRFRPLVTLAAAALLIAAGVLGLLIAAGALTPHPTPSPSPSGKPTAPPPSPTPVPSLGAWTHVTLTTVASPAFESTADDGLGLGTVWPEGFLIIGHSETGDVEWRSADGTNWTRTPVPAFDGHTLMGLVWTGQRLIVVAETTQGYSAVTPPVGFAWASSDGITWTPVADPSLARTVPDSIATSPAGVVIAGSAIGSGLRLLHSNDGLAWVVDDATALTPGGGTVGSVAGWPGGFLLSATVPPLGFPPHVGVYRSVDGLDWVEGSAPEGAQGLGFVTAGDNIIATGNLCLSCIGAFAAWSTRDHGSTWQLLPEPSNVSYRGFSITTIGTRFVEDSAGGLRWSDDGHTWHALATSGANLPSNPSLVLASGSRLVFSVDGTGIGLTGQLH